MTDRVPVLSTEQVIEAAAPVVAREESNEAPLPKDIMGSFIKTRMAEIMGREGDSEDLDFELENILQWARDKGATSPEEIFWEIRELMHRLGTPGVGENRVKWVNKYVYFDKEKKVVNQEMERMEYGY